MLYLMTSIEENPVLPFDLGPEAIFTLKWREKASWRFLSGECIQWHRLRKRLRFWKNQRVYLFRLFGDQRDGMLLSNETRENRCAYASGIASCGSTSEVQCSLWGEIKAEWKTVTVDVERWRDHYANAFGALSLVTCELRPISAWSPSDGRGGVTKVPFSSILAEELSNLQGAWNTLEVVIIRGHVCPYIVVFASDNSDTDGPVEQLKTRTQTI